MVLACLAFLTEWLPAQNVAEKPPAPSAAEAPGPSWVEGLTPGLRRAMTQRKPIFARAVAAGCPWCRKLDEAVKTPEVQSELGRWTLVEVDVNRSPEDAAQLGATTTPALRILTPGGQPIASRDGSLGAKELAAWLQKHFAAASAATDDVLVASGMPDAADVVRLVKQFHDRNPVLREAAVRRLLPYPDGAREAVVRAFEKGNLSARLAAMELLSAWKAPVEKLDPWQPDSLTAERLAALAKWAAGPLPKPAVAPEKLTEAQWAEARRELDRLLRVAPSDADAIREHLARFGPALLPEVYERLKRAATDEDRQRLLALRYRLVADGVLVLKWPGGLERLAAADSRQRQQAAEELARMATAGEQALLLELFSDPDPLVRETSLRGLQQIGGPESTSALVKLLDDPEPNVRAAVLKQLAEKPLRTLVPQIAAYVAKERDADLVVHAIRFLRVAKGQDALRCLISLLPHPQWQVRAEAAEGIGQVLLERAGIPNDLQADAHVAMIKLLDDADGFVVSRALAGLNNLDSEEAVEPLLRAAERHPDLIPRAVEMLARSSRLRARALPKLRSFAKHKDPAARAAALRGLVMAVPDEVQEEIKAGLQDPEGQVRIAAASALFSSLEMRRRRPGQIGPIQIGPIRVEASVTWGSDSAPVAVSMPTPRLPEPIKVEPPKPREPLTTGVVRFMLGSKDQKTPAAKSAKPEPPPTIAPLIATPQEPSRIATFPEPQLGPQRIRVLPVPGQKPEPPGATADDAQDRWLQSFYEGQGRPAWMTQMVEPLEKMLRAETGAERVEAALVLVPLGKADRALPVLLETVRVQPQLVLRAKDVLPWLVWEKRLETFRTLAKLSGAEIEAGALVSTMTEAGDRRSADLLWELLADPKLKQETAFMLHQGLRQAYLGQRYGSVRQIPAAARREMAAAVKAHAARGTELERLVALGLLTEAAPEEAAQVAAQMAGDAQLSQALRVDAFQVVLLTQPVDAALKTALEAMAGQDVERRRLALSLLVDGKAGLRSLRSQFYLQLELTADAVVRSADSGQALRPPTGLRIEHVRPFLTHADPQVAAYAGYLAALLGEREGLPPLLKYWRSRQAEERSEGLDRLVYRAIAVLDDSSQVAVLREIVARLNPVEMRDLYWTIRGMTGQEMLQLRKEIRDKVGMENLR
jgi:HEAT repeat protein